MHVPQYSEYGYVVDLLRVFLSLLCQRCRPERSPNNEMRKRSIPDVTWDTPLRACTCCFLIVWILRTVATPERHACDGDTAQYNRVPVQTTLRVHYSMLKLANSVQIYIIFFTRAFSSSTPPQVISYRGVKNRRKPYAIRTNG